MRQDRFFEDAKALGLAAGCIYTGKHHNDYVVGRVVGDTLVIMGRGDTRTKALDGAAKVIAQRDFTPKRDVPPPTTTSPAAAGPTGPAS